MTSAKNAILLLTVFYSPVKHKIRPSQLDHTTVQEELVHMHNESLTTELKSVYLASEARVLVRSISYW